MADALRYREQSLELAVRIGHVGQEVFCRVNLVEILTTTGEWAEARTHLRRAEEIEAARSVAAWVTPMVPNNRGMLALRDGDWDAAHELLERAAGLGRAANAEYCEYAQAGLAELAILEGRPHEARHSLQELVEEEGANLPLLLPILAWAQLELGKTEHGLELAERAEQETRARQTLLYLPEALWIKGMALSRLGRTEEAREALTDGRERAAAMPNPHTEARILMELGLLDRRMGRGEQATEYLDAALAIFQRLGARKDVERTEQALV